MGVRLHPKHGLNPTMTTCFGCGESKDILLVGNRTQQFLKAGIKLGYDGAMPSSIGCVDKEPCPKCEEYMERGIILISVRDGEESDTPYRTGDWIVVKEEMIQRMIQPGPLLDHILSARMAFVPDEVWNGLGLPRGGVE